MPKTGAERIVAERKRQIEEERWDKEHDTSHADGEMAMAAACYASPNALYTLQTCARDPFERLVFSDPWPWDSMWDKRKKHDRIRQLEIAGALCAAEIDRLLAEK